MVGDDQIHAELARALRGVGAANPAVHRDHEAHAVGVQPLDRRGLQAVPVAEPLGQKVHDVAAEELQRAAQDHRGRDAVDVVVAVNRNPLVVRHRREHTIDRHAHSGERHRIVELVERRIEKPERAFGIGEAALAEEPRDDGRDVESGGKRRRRRGVARK